MVSTGKERDPETGYSYFGARYLDHTPLTLWLSVDPMADKYPSISPYTYCAWNPLKLLDPNGREVVIVGANIGKILQKLSYKNLNISYNNETGRSEAALNNCTVNELSKEELMIYQAIEDPNVRVQIMSYTAAIDPEGNDCFIDPQDMAFSYKTEGGTFYEGRIAQDLETGNSIARTTCFVDVDLLDKYGYDNGVPHEITECYLVGIEMLERNIPHVKMAILEEEKNPVILKAHRCAIPEKKGNNIIQP